MRCPECLANMKQVTGRHDYVESGLDNITLLNVPIYECHNNHRLPVIPDITGLHRVLSQAILEKESPLTGKEIRFLRKEMGFKAKDLADLLGVSKEYLSKLENGKAKISTTLDNLTRLIFIRKKEEETDKRQLAHKPMKELLRKTSNELLSLSDSFCIVSPKVQRIFGHLTDSPHVCPWVAAKAVRELKACKI